MNSQVNLTDIAYRAMLQRNLEPDFSPAVAQELNNINQPAACPTSKQARDMRDKLFFSIDNDDSRDLDQLTYAEEHDGFYTLYVAIADVSSLVKKGSAIDSHAKHNTTSVYTPTKIFTMLPEKLSYDLTSLNPDVDRTAMVVQLRVNADGTAGEYSIFPACVHNYAKLAYNRLAKWLTGEESSPPDGVTSVAGLEQQIRLQDKIAQILKQKRIAQGSLILETIESKPIIKDNKVVELEEVVKNRARELIEEFMVAANIATTLFLEHHNCPSLRRVVREPKNWDRIVVLASKYGTRLPETPQAKPLQQFLEERQKADPESFPDLSLAVIKLLGRGEYVVWMPGESETGHFGLAIKRYTHATAPNRRFPDLITQRLLKAAIYGDVPPYGEKELIALAAQCTEQEDNAEKVERKAEKSAAASMLLPLVGQTFGGIITGASNKGTWVRVFRPPVEGKVIRGDQGLEVGDRVRVKLVQVVVEEGFIDFEVEKEGVRSQETGDRRRK